MKLYKIILTVIGVLCLSILLRSQPISDTLRLNFGESSHMTINLNSMEDYEVLQSYDVDSLVDQMTRSLQFQEQEIEVVDTDEAMEDERDGITIYLWDDEILKYRRSRTDDDDEYDEDDYEDERDYDVEIKKRKFPRWRKYFEIDFGLNNYIADGVLSTDTDEAYAVRHWGSWTVALNSVLATRFSRGFSTETSLGISWYNFKFQDDDTRLIKTDDEISFVFDESGRNNTKSKLTVAYINAQFVPVFRIGKSRKFGLGLGGYVGYRVDSYTKNVFEIDGDKEKDRNRDNLFLNRWRYGARLQFGINGHDFFFNYDLNTLFQENRGPKLNAISFGVII